MQKTAGISDLLIGAEKKGRADDVGPCSLGESHGKVVYYSNVPANRLQDSYEFIAEEEWLCSRREEGRRDLISWLLMTMNRDESMAMVR